MAVSVEVWEGWLEGMGKGKMCKWRWVVHVRYTPLPFLQLIRLFLLVLGRGH